MKKLFALLLALAMIASASHALYVNSNTAVTSWNTTFEGSSTSDYVVTSGCQYAWLTIGDSTVGTVTAEALWYLTSGSAVLISTEAFPAGAALQVKTPRAKFKLYESGAGYATAEATVYCY
jgi:hypothetical protein